MEVCDRNSNSGGLTVDFNTRLGFSVGVVGAIGIGGKWR